jgi:F-type H+-transporting ATPase subunit g
MIISIHPAYQQPVKYNLTVAREVLKHVYAAEDLQLPVPTFLGAVLGTYGTLWVRAREVGYWCEVVCSGEFVQLSVYAVEAYGIFKVRFSLSVTLFGLIEFLFYLVDW